MEELKMYMIYNKDNILIAMFYNTVDAVKYIKMVDGSYLKNVNIDDENLITTINEDCKTWEQLNNSEKLLNSYMYLNACVNSAENGLYQLILNGSELWYGTLEEINAIVKSMITRIKTNDNLN